MRLVAMHARCHRRTRAEREASRPPARYVIASVNRVGVRVAGTPSVLLHRWPSPVGSCVTLPESVALLRRSIVRCSARCLPGSGHGPGDLAAASVLCPDMPGEERWAGAPTQAGIHGCR